MEKATDHPGSRIALVAPTFGDGRDTMVEGESGLLSICDPLLLRGGSVESGWNRSIGEVYFANGTKARVFSSEKPGRLRGPQHHFAWCDEAAQFLDAGKGEGVVTNDDEGTTWSNMKLGLRLGARPRCIVTTTPKPNRLIKALVAQGGAKVHVTSGSTYDNLENLAPAFREEILDTYEGTRLGRQEIHAEILDDVEGALWTRALLDEHRLGRLPAGFEFSDVVVAVDPNVTESEAANEAGIVVCGVGSKDRRGYVLADLSLREGPQAWARQAGVGYRQWLADRVVAEKNNGGDLVRFLLKTVNPDVPVKLVNASRGKRPRAEPVAALYEQGRISHVGSFPELEDQMCTWTPDVDESPDRMDALVWGLTDLIVAPAQGRQYQAVETGASEPTIRKGGLTLKGDRYVDKEPKR